MRRLLALGIVLLVLGTWPVHAQYVVTSSDPASGEASVATSTKIQFRFSDDVNVETDWNTAFVYEPRDAITVKQANLILDNRGRASIVEFVIEQEPDTDYTWMVYDIQKPERYGSTPLDEPYVLRYSTASSMGPHQVQGTVGASPPSAAGKRGGSEPTVRRGTWRRLVDMAQASGLGRPEQNAKAGAKSGSDPARDATHIFLLKHFTAQPSAWQVEAGTVIEGDAGPYAVDHVRDGTYWPLAVRYADRHRTEIEALGFHDADGDGAPDPIAVSGSGITGVDLTLVPFPRTTARNHLMDAEAAAEEEADDQRLIAVRGGEHTQTDGTSYAWTYQYYSPSLEQETVVTVDPIGTSTKTQPAFEYIKTMSAVPASLIDSDQAVQMVLDDGGQQLVDACPAGDLDVVVEAGNLYWLVPYPTSAVIWRVRLEGKTGSSNPNAETCNQVFERYLDAETGEILDPSALPVELVAFAAQADGTDVVLRWETVSETQNAGFEVQLQERGSMGTWEQIGFVDGAGTTSEPQRYRYRVTNLGPGTHRFRLRQVDLDGTATYSAEVEARLAVEDGLIVEPPYPNPLSDRATVRVGLRRGGSVTVTLFDALGRRVRHLYTGPVDAGRMQPIQVEGRGLASGRYYLRVVADEGRRVQVQPLTVLR